MPAGDAQRVWFAEMLDELKRFWCNETSWEQLADFCQLMTEKRQEIRLARGIQPPRTASPEPGVRCPECGQTAGANRHVPSGVSIRSALFALQKTGVITRAEFKELDKSWMKYKKESGVDAYGRTAVLTHTRETHGPVAASWADEG